MTYTHALAYVYFFLAQYGDSEGVTADESASIVLKIHDWNT